jgi:DNA-directed RNA polymerase subunit RPC12/RpoP
MSHLHPDDELPRLPASWDEALRLPSMEEALRRGVVCISCWGVFNPRSMVVDRDHQGGDLYRCPECGSPNIDWALL